MNIYCVNNEQAFKCSRVLFLDELRSLWCDIQQTLLITFKSFVYKYFLIYKKCCAKERRSKRLSKERHFSLSYDKFKISQRHFNIEILNSWKDCDVTWKLCYLSHWEREECSLLPRLPLLKELLSIVFRFIFFLLYFLFLLLHSKPKGFLFRKCWMNYKKHAYMSWFVENKNECKTFENNERKKLTQKNWKIRDHCSCSFFCKNKKLQ